MKYPHMVKSKKLLNHSTLIPRYPDVLRILSEKAGNPAGCEVSSMFFLYTCQKYPATEKTLSVLLLIINKLENHVQEKKLWIFLY